MIRIAAKSPLDSIIVLADVVRELELVAGHSLREFREGVYVRRAAERLVQLAVDLSCEIALRALNSAGRRLPVGCEEAFRGLHPAGLLAEPLVEKMTSAVDLRRRILMGWGGFEPGQDPDEELHRRLPFLVVLFREYGRRMEEIVQP
jgi:uncharacterized protein YutE (UPF0331/DUF86 family)